jgi:phage shock protein PspC (stress-responsive transcriptional regulator)
VFKVEFGCVCCGSVRYKGVDLVVITVIVLLLSLTTSLAVIITIILSTTIHPNPILITTTVQELPYIYNKLFLLYLW